MSEDAHKLKLLALFALGGRDIKDHLNFMQTVEKSVRPYGIMIHTYVTRLSLNSSGRDIVQSLVPTIVGGGTPSIHHHTSCRSWPFNLDSLLV